VGVDYSGGVPIATRNIQDNLPDITIPYNPKTKYFGTAGTSATVREVYAQYPVSEAEKFFATLTYGGVKSKLPNGKGIKANMANGTVVTIRPTTKSLPYPAVDISISKAHSPEVKAQKIHFKLIEEDK